MIWVEHGASAEILGTKLAESDRTVAQVGPMSTGIAQIGLSTTPTEWPNPVPSLADVAHVWPNSANNLDEIGPNSVHTAPASALCWLTSSKQWPRPPRKTSPSPLRKPASTSQMLASCSGRIGRSGRKQADKGDRPKTPFETSFRHGRPHSDGTCSAGRLRRRHWRHHPVGGPTRSKASA